MIKRLITIAAIALAMAGCGPSHKALTEKMNSPDVSTRRAAIKELRGAKKNKKLTPAIMKACQDPDTDVRMYGYYTIGKVDPRDDDDIPSILIAGMRDTSVQVRRALASSLGDINPFPTSVLPHMVKMLIDPDDKVRTLVHSALADMEGIGMGALMRQIETKDEDLRLSIVNVLGSIGPPAKSALPSLRKMAKEEENLPIKEAAERAIKYIENK